MDRRSDKRIKKSMLLDVNDNPGTLVDISRKGMRLSTAIPRTGRDLDIALHTDSKTYNLQGMIHWICKKDGRNNFREIGVRVNDAPQDYHQFLDTLNWNRVDNSEYGWVLIVLCIMLFIGSLVGILTFFDLVKF